MSTLITKLDDIKTFRHGLVTFHHSKNTCNELHFYISEIISYVKLNGLDNQSYSDFPSLLKKTLSNIDPELLYRSESKRTIRKFRVPQYEAYIILGLLISHIESEMENNSFMP